MKAHLIISVGMLLAHLRPRLARHDVAPAPLRYPDLKSVRRAPERLGRDGLDGRGSASAGGGRSGAAEEGGHPTRQESRG